MAGGQAVLRSRPIGDHFQTEELNVSIDRIDADARLGSSENRATTNAIIHATAALFSWGGVTLCGS
jgi:hypothetical protein